MDKLIDKTGWNFTIVSNSIIDNEEIDIYQKMLYITLKRFANVHTAKAFPGAKRLSSLSGMSERKVRSVLKELEESKLLHIEYRLHKTSIYTLLEWPAQDAGVAHGAGGVLHTVQGGTAHGATELKKHEQEKVEQEKTVVSVSENVKKFDEWWKLYGKSIDKKKCSTKYNSLLKRYSHETMMEGTKKYKQHLIDLKKRGEFSPNLKNPHTFLNGENFNDLYDDSQAVEVTNTSMYKDLGGREY